MRGRSPPTSSATCWFNARSPASGVRQGAPSRSSRSTSRAALATGTGWNGCAVNQGPTVYVAAEGGADLPKRRQAWEHRHDIEATGVYLVPEAPNMLDPPDVGAFIVSLREVAPVLVVVDTLARTMVGNENDTVDMSRYVAACDRIAHALQCAVVIVHHCGWSGAHERGASALRAAVETSILVEQTEKGTVTVRCTRQKNDSEFEACAFTLATVDLGTDSEGEPITSCVLEGTETKPASLTAPQRIMLSALAASAKFGATHNEWLTATSQFTTHGKPLVKSTFCKVRPLLKAKGLVHQEGKVYSITADGEKALASGAK